MRMFSTGSRARALGHTLAPRGWRDVLLQVAVLGSFQFVYALTGIYGREKTEVAVANGQGILRFEQRLGIAWEHGIQTRVLGAPHVFVDVANRTYFICQFTVSTIFLIWVYVRHTDRFNRVRNALLAANYVSVLTLFVFPAAPPRLLPGAGFVDTLNADTINLHTHIIDMLNNPYSTMPSLHASYAIVVGVAGFTLVRRSAVKVLFALYPLLVFYSVIATGNHFVLDVVAGAVALLATPLIESATWLSRAAHLRLRLAPLAQVVILSVLAACLFSISETTRMT